MIVGSDTPFAYLIYANEDAQARLFDILIVKATYVLDEAGYLVPDIEQEPLNFSDRCYGEVNVTSLRAPSDLVPFKPAADVIVNAVACAPGTEPQAKWTSSLRVGKQSWALDITGPRDWLPRRKGKWELSDPEPIRTVPLTYDMAFGGEFAKADGTIVTDERNPLGRGHFDPSAEGRDPVPAAQVLWAGAKMTRSGELVEPASFGAIPPAWLPRRLLGGTYDAAWLEQVWPHWAKDYDFAFHNSAHPRLVCSDGLTGKEQIQLMNLHPEAEDISFSLPGDEVLAMFTDFDGQRKWIPLRLDTMLIDLADKPLSELRVQLTWRVPFLSASVAQIDIRSRFCSGPGLPPKNMLGSAPTPFHLFTAHKTLEPQQSEFSKDHRHAG